MSLNDGFTYCERVDPDAAPSTLLSYLARHHRHSSRAEWTARIESGEVLLDAAPTTTEVVLRRGQELVWRRPPWEEPAAPLAFRLLYDDGDLLAVDKPSGLPTLPGANFLQHTLHHQVRLHAPDAVPIHRLGRWTSGLVLFARGRSARAELARQLRAREMRKRYRALASGDPAWNAITVDHPIGLVAHPLLLSVHAAARNGKSAVSRIEVIERRLGSFLCDVWIATGRPHQIRIHLAAVGHPLVGDPLYLTSGLPAADSRAVPGDPGYLLHAAEVTLHHPRDGRELVLTCTPPPELSASA
jgi:23S rRNA pseudouridine1911/1915/1917 synthase